MSNRKKDEEEALHRLKWIGKVVHMACNTETYPFKDNEASRFKANEANAKKPKLKEDKKKEEGQRKRDEEGEECSYKPGRHMPQKVMHIS